MIMVNGRRVEHVEGETVRALLERMRYVFPLVIVTIDGEIVPRDRYGSVRVPDGATVEVMHLTSGG